MAHVTFCNKLCHHDHEGGTNPGIVGHCVVKWGGTIKRGEGGSMFGDYWGP